MYKLGSTYRTNSKKESKINRKPEKITEDLIPKYKVRSVLRKT